MTPSPQTNRVASRSGSQQEGALVRFGLALANWSERWFPDPLVFAFIGIVVVFITGLLLSIAESATNYHNVAFRVKLLLLLLVGLNPLIFHLTVYRSVNTWDVANVTPARARAAATCSLVLWTGIIVAGRMIAYLH